MGDVTTKTPARVFAGNNPEPEIVAFQLGGWSYGIDVVDVEGIYHGLPLIPCFKKAPFRDGDVMIRQQRIPVVNLRRFLGAPDYIENPPGWIVVVKHRGHPVGLVVDCVNEVLKVSVRNLRTAVNPGAGPVGNYVTAKAETPEYSVQLPDFSRLLTEVLD